jgi:hypothetical protein
MTTVGGSSRVATLVCNAHETTSRRSVSVLFAFALLFFIGCKGFTSVIFGPKEPPKPVDTDDNSKAFAELEKNDRDDPKSKPDAGVEEKPKGPVYPAPFTAEQIRDATKSGRTYRYKVEELNKATRERTVTFRNVDANGAEIFTGGPSPRRMGWLALQQGSEFPKDKVTTREEKIKLPAGKFDCLVYEVAMEEGEVWTYYFGKQLPGAPVYYYVERNGKRLRTTTLVEHISGK